MAKRPKKPQKMWVYSPPRRPKPHVPNDVKAEVDARARDLVENVLKPKAIQPHPLDYPFNYIVDISITWWRSYLYFVATYRSPGPNALSASFEVRFTRMEYIGNRHFALAYMRHTGQWQEVFPGLSIDECFATIRDESLFGP
jgi:hypothetical protein